MDLIIKNKVLDYIKQYPLAKPALLIWIKEFSDQHVKEFESSKGLIHASASLHGDYVVSYLINPWLQAGYISWFGTAQELQEIRHNKPRIPGTITTTIMIRHPMMRKHMVKPVKAATIKTNKPIPYSNATNIEWPLLVTYSEFEKASNRAIEIFDATPGTPEFTELSTLILSIKDYEEKEIKLLELSLLDVIKFKLDELKMLPEHLPHIADKETIELFLAGKTMLPNKALKKLYNKLRINFDIPTIS